MGSIGQYVAKLSQAFGTILVYHDIHRATEHTEWQYGIEYLELPKLLQTSDIISLHIPLTTGTRYLIDTKEITLMKSTAVIINMSRGGVVNETALAAALTSGHIAGAACDTLEGEPNIEGHPLLSCPNFHCTPHVGAGTKDTLRRVLTIAFANIRAVEKGKKPQFIVNECISSRG
jgi:phosphoglycerate dehydrogenase-like enzyme